MNAIIASLMDRKSMRAYTDEPITDAHKELILGAAYQAPTAGNQQMYTILDITDESLKERLAVTCDNQPFIAKAKMVLIFLADIQKWYDTFLEGGCEPRKPGVGDLLLSVTDAAIAAQNAVVAAESLGIGSCYIGDIMERCEEHRELLRLPEYVFPAAMLVFGYPTEQQKQRVKPARNGTEYIVCRNAYRQKSSRELREMHRKEWKDQSFEEWSQAFCKRKYNSDFSREMSRSVQAYLDTFQTP